MSLSFQVFQTSPVGYGQVADSGVTATNLQQDFYHGKSALTLQDTNVSATDGPYDATKDASTGYSGVNDAHIEETITGLKPSTVYAVGAYMRTLSATAEAIVDLTGEATTPDASTVPAPTLA